ncbi:MAG: hypothetical protein JRI34_02120 [Deltaproteobacteria bacterium]|nr:hypothetical protein [Deltaproteobacteria bacterium]
MNDDLQTILNALQERLTQPQDFLNSPFLYLDPEGVLYWFQELTGLRDLPRMRINPGGDIKIEITFTAGSGGTLPLHLVCRALIPLLKQKVPFIQKKEDLLGLVQRYAWVQGTLQGTHFPDGSFNVEILFCDLRGVLFYTKDFFSSMVRPLLDNDRIYTLKCSVEALVYVHDEIIRQIFYHHTFGDNREHDWLPLVPVAIQTC